MDALHEASVDALSFASPMQALDAIEASEQAKNLVTRNDFGTGRLSGVALARMVKLKQPGMDVVFVGWPRNAEHVEEAGDFVPLPLDPQTLVETVSRRLSP